MISAVFRRGGDVSFVVEELKAVFDPRGGAWMEGRYVPSLLAAIGGVIERHMIDIGFLQPREAASGEEQRAVVNLGNPAANTRFAQCPKCGGARSEEHTSELQSLMRISYAVFCLKKQK